MQLKPDAPQLTWQGSVSLQKTEDWVMPWRTPAPDARSIPGTTT